MFNLNDPASRVVAVLGAVSLANRPTEVIYWLDKYATIVEINQREQLVIERLEKMAGIVQGSTVKQFLNKIADDRFSPAVTTVIAKLPNIVGPEAVALAVAVALLVNQPYEGVVKDALIRAAWVRASFETSDDGDMLKGEAWMEYRAATAHRYIDSIELPTTWKLMVDTMEKVLG